MSVLESQPTSELTPTQFGQWMQRRLGRKRPFSDQTVRNWIKEGLPSHKRGRRFFVTDCEGALRWWREHVGISDHGGERPGAGGKIAAGRTGLDRSTALAAVAREGQREQLEDGRRDAAPTVTPTPTVTGAVAGAGAAPTEYEDVVAGGITGKKEQKLDVETRLKELDYAKKLGQVIDRQEAAEGTSRVLGAFVRELAKLPDKLADAVAERMRLAPEERHIVRTLTADEVTAMRRYVAEHPLGDVEDEIADDGRQDAAPTGEEEA